MEMDGAVPQQNEHSFADWWVKYIPRVKKEYKKGVNSLIILTSWLIWKHRNSCVFDGATPSVNEVLRQFRDEYELWCLYYYRTDLLSRAVTAFSPGYRAGTTIPGLKVEPSVSGHRAGTKEGPLVPVGVTNRD